MPSAAVVRAAIPACPREHTNPGFRVLAPKGCPQRLRYHQAGNVWSCPKHGAVWRGGTLVLIAAGYAVASDGEVLAV